MRLLNKGDRVRCVRTMPGATREVGWEGHVKWATVDEVRVDWDSGDDLGCLRDDVEFLHAIRTCPDCEEERRDPEFDDDDYLCRSCRLGPKV